MAGLAGAWIIDCLASFRVTPLYHLSEPPTSGLLEATASREEERGENAWLVVPNDDAHVGTMDLDVGLTLALLDEGRYRTLTDRLHNAGLAQGVNEEGHPTRQRWKIEALGAIIAFSFFSGLHDLRIALARCSPLVRLPG